MSTTRMRNEDTATGDAATRIAARTGMIGTITFVLLVIVGGLLTGGYSHVSQKISELGATGAQYATLQNLNFMILGVGVVSFAWALHRTPGTTVMPSVLVGFFGVVAFAHAFVPCDTGCRGETPMGLLHNVTGLMGFVAVIAGMLLVARQWQRVDERRSHVPFTRGAAYVAIVGLLGFVATQALDVQTFAGLVQRVYAGSFLLWIAVTSSLLARGDTLATN
jgi:hypothetical membrane protein